MKKLLIFAISMIFVCIFAFSVNAEEINGVHYTLDHVNKVATVNTENRKATTEIVTIPSEIEFEGAAYKVTKIANDAFYGNKSVVELRILSEYITEIPTSMIADTHGGNLKKVYIDFSNITSIGGAAFNPSPQTNGNDPKINAFYYYDAKAFLQTGEDVLITEPDFSNVTSIGAAAFQGANFTKLTIPAGLTVINTQVFRCTSIQELVIEGENRETLGYYSFNACKSLTKITIKSRNLKSVQNDVFANCTSLEEIYIDLSQCKTISTSAFSFAKYYDSGNKLTKWYNLEGEAVVDLSNVTELKERCFASSNLGSAKIIWPKALTMIQSQVFRKCNIKDTMVINAAPGSSLNLEFWCFEGNAPTYVFCNEGVVSTGARFSGVTAVFLADNLKITDSNGGFEGGSVAYFKSLSSDSVIPNGSKCTVNYVSDGTIANYGACGAIATVTMGDEKITLGVVSHTTSDAIDNTLCPVGKVNATSCAFCDYVKYTVDGNEVEKKEHEYNLTGSITYVSFYEMGFKTNKCVCGAEKANETATEAAIFEYRGISVCQFADVNGKHSMTLGYYINQEAYQSYIASGKTLEVGVIVCAKKITGATPLFIDENGKVLPVNGEKTFVTTDSATVNSYLDIIVSGISKDKNGEELIMSIYLSTGEEIFYLNEKNQSTEAEAVKISIEE